MADRIVVMNHGVIEQVGSPEEIYRFPATPFVADFVGHMTFLDAIVSGPGRVSVGGLELSVAHDAAFAPGTAVRLAMRPEDVRTRSVTPETPNCFDAKVDRLAFLGAFCRAKLSPTTSPATPIAADFSTNAMRDLAIAEGEIRAVAFPPESLRVFPAEPRHGCRFHRGLGAKRCPGENHPVHPRRSG